MLSIIPQKQSITNSKLDSERTAFDPLVNNTEEDPVKNIYDLNSEEEEESMTELSEMIISVFDEEYDPGNITARLEQS